MEDLIFNCKGKRIKNGSKTILAGILNVTPDSFSDGGRYTKLKNAIDRVALMIEEGALMIDVGGESTRPGSKAISEEEEMSRVLPAIEAIRKRWSHIFISLDTWRANVAKAGLKAGADIINDITALLGDAKMASVIKEADAALIAMFNPLLIRPNHEGSKVFRKFGYGEPFSKDEMSLINKLEIVDAMKVFFAKTLSICKEMGIGKDHIMLDPGIGFGLTLKENLSLLESIESIHNMGYLSFVGISRKRFIIKLLQDIGCEIDISTEKGLLEADEASAFFSSILAFNSANVLRVHNVAFHAKAILAGDAVRRAKYEQDINFSQYLPKKNQ